MIFKTIKYKKASSRLIRQFSIKEIITPNYPFQDLPRKVEREEELSIMKKRLLYQSRKRGISEMDLLFSTFVHKNLDKFNSEQCKELDYLFELPDWDILYWLKGERKVPEEIRKLKVYIQLKEHSLNEGRKVLRMPDLK